MKAKRNINCDSILHFGLSFCILILAFSICVSAANAATSTKIGSSVQSGDFLTNGLVGYWTFNNSDINWKTGVVTDRSGKGNNGQLIAMSTTSSPVEGKMGQALSFNGNSQYVDIPSTIYSSSGGTISLWAYRTGAGSGADAVIGSFGGTGNERAPTFELYGSDIGWDFGSQFNQDTGVIFTPKKWFHIVLTYDANWHVNVYVNSIQVASNIISSSPLPFYSAVYIGGYANYGTHYFQGTIDDVRIYNRALSASEVLALYNEGATKLASSNQSGNFLTSGLVGYWTFNNSDINWKTGVVTDRSGRGNNGQLIAMPTTSSPVEGKMGEALGFNGTSQYVLTGSVTTPSSYTYNLWERTNSKATGIYIMNQSGYKGSIGLISGIQLLTQIATLLAVGQQEALIYETINGIILLAYRMVLRILLSSTLMEYNQQEELQLLLIQVLQIP